MFKEDCKVKGKDSNLDISSLLAVDLMKGALTFTKAIAKELRCFCKAQDVNRVSETLPSNGYKQKILLFVFQTKGDAYIVSSLQTKIL